MSNQKLQVNLAVAVTPSDTVDVARPSGGGNYGCVLYVGVSGDLKVTPSSGSEIIFKNVSVGFFPVQVVRVWATGTAATEIIALW
jgi:hypothetical protein